jgi:hypothetical protein
MDQFSQDPMSASAPDDGASHRRDSRDSLFLAARFRLRGDSKVEHIRVRNLSSGGLMAELADPIDQDTPVEVDVRGIGWIAGTVAWTAVGRAGIAFDRPIDPLKARKPVGRGAQSPTFVKPVLPKR